MAQIFRREPAASSTQERPKPRLTTAGGDSGSTGRVARLRTSINDILSELRKVTWPTREETRNLTIVVIGISVVLGVFLGGMDLLFAQLYTLINP